jgi:hypothetical protein
VIFEDISGAFDGRKEVDVEKEPVVLQLHGQGIASLRNACIVNQHLDIDPSPLKEFLNFTIHLFRVAEV